ncbi:MAG: hypothetical protein J6T08_10590 [Lentisphaeria bacterium]|nr:hypothetical protein [Lentisphaeria bacterium]
MAERKGYGKIFLLLICCATMCLCNGCLSAVVFHISGSNDADEPNKESSEFYRKLPKEQIVTEMKLPKPMDPPEIKAFVEKNISAALGVPVEAVLPKPGKNEEALSPAVRLVVYRFPGANRHEMVEVGSLFAFIVVGTLGILEVGDPVVLPFAIYSHIKAYGGERYVTVFFDAQDRKVFAYGCNVLNGEIARPPKNCGIDIAWFTHAEKTSYLLPGKKTSIPDQYYLMDGTLFVRETEKSEAEDANSKP